MTDLEKLELEYWDAIYEWLQVVKKIVEKW